MNIRWFIAILYVVVPLVTAVLSSCEHTFPYDKLNNYWSLDWIEYKGEVNQRGVACEYDECDNVMFGFAYHIVLVEDISHIFAKHDIILEHSDFIKLDYSVYDDTQLASQCLIMVWKALCHGSK